MGAVPAVPDHGVGLELSGVRQSLGEAVALIAGDDGLTAGERQEIAARLELALEELRGPVPQWPQFFRRVQAALSSLEQYTASPQCSCPVLAAREKLAEISRLRGRGG